MAPRIRNPLARQMLRQATQQAATVGVLGSIIDSLFQTIDEFHPPDSDRDVHPVVRAQMRLVKVYKETLETLPAPHTKDPSNETVQAPRE